MNSKNTYLYDLHVHNRMGSNCSSAEPTDMVDAYIAAGYVGFCFTDHFIWGNTAVDRRLPWEQKMRLYFEPYQIACDYVKDKDFDVFFGIEHNYGNGKEVLTYGIDLEFLLKNPDIHKLPIEKYTQLAREYGGFVSMAHPFRDRPYINMSVRPPIHCLDALEVYNACNYPEENERAKQLAVKHNLKMTSGGDVHHTDEKYIGMAGIAVNHRIKTGKELVSVLKSGEYNLICGKR